MSTDHKDSKESKSQKKNTEAAVKSPAEQPEVAVEQPAEKAPETAKSLLSDEVVDLKIRRAKGSKNITQGICNVLATFNNTKVCFTDLNGNVISWSSAGKCNFRGSRKSTAYAAQVVTQEAAKVAISHGLKDVEIKLKGPGMGRDAAARALQSLGLNVLNIEDVTPVPHNGCRPRKRRRV